MKFKNVLYILIGALSALAISLGLAIQFEITWLKFAALVVIPVSAALITQAFKVKSLSRSRADAIDSYEAVADRNASSRSFVDATVIVAIAALIGTLFPSAPAGLVSWSCLLLICVSYWVRRAKNG